MRVSQNTEANKKLTVKMILFFLGGAALGGPVVAWWLYEIKQLSWLSSADGKYEAKIPEVPAVKAKETAFYCGSGVNKKYVGCN